MKSHTMQFFLCALTITVFINCKPTAESNANGVTELKQYFSPQEPGVQNGNVKMVTIETPKGPLKVWTKRVGNNPSIKLLTLNGGPGCTHEYFECFESFLPAEGIEFIYYDQLGCGNSDNPEDTSFWNLSRYVEEVETVRKALNLDK